MGGIYQRIPLQRLQLVLMGGICPGTWLKDSAP